jgi:hypothetical protein
MRRILILISVFISTVSYSQLVVNNDLNKFSGTWKWTSGNDTMVIVLEKQVVTLPGGRSNEVLVGWHEYIKNGQVAQSSLQHTGLRFDNEQVPLGNDLQITLYGVYRTVTEIWFVRFWDLSTHKKCNLSFELLPNSTTQARWKLRGQTVLPQDLILTKL